MSCKLVKSGIAPSIEFPIASVAAVIASVAPAIAPVNAVNPSLTVCKAEFTLALIPLAVPMRESN